MSSAARTTKSKTGVTRGSGTYLGQESLTESPIIWRPDPRSRSPLHRSRSFVCEPIQYKRLFLCGDAAHIVPPTGAKGLNLAFSDVYYLSKGLIQYFSHSDETALQNYSSTALARIWKSERFSWWMTSLLHKFDEQDSFGDRMRRAEFDFLMESEDYQRALANNYIGLPY